MFQILIVEDDKELSQLFQKVLEKNGYQVKSASDGAQALEVLDKEYIDLIISDIMMPVMDGYELVSELRSAGYQIPVLMITAKGSFDDMRQGFLSGSDDYMVKPVNVNEMVLRVGALLRRAQILNEHKIVIGSTEFDYDAMTVTTDKEYIDLIISDIMMPVMDGYELVSELRSAGYQIPVLMITAKGSFDDMRQGFLSGSDDYMVKPVNVNEMVLRVGALLRRAQILNEHKIVIGSTEFDYDAMTVTTDKESLVLPKKEFLLLYKLAASPGRTFTKQQLMDEVWGYETEADPHTIEVHIGRIRERFKDNPDFEIVTMRGIGYKVVKK